MSRTFYKEIKFKHWNDCNSSGCKGHTMQLVSENCVDMMIIKIDGKQKYFFEDGEWKALLEAVSHFNVEIRGEKK